MSKLADKKLDKNVSFDGGKNKIISYAIIAGIVLIALFILSIPLKTYSVKKYISKGDEFLAQKKYLHAELEYEKGQFFSRKNNDLKTQRALARECQENVLKLEDFYKGKSKKEEADKITQATVIPENESEALKLAKKYIEDKEYQLAIIPARTATEMDPNYRDAWLYLGIANQKTAELVELTKEMQDKYLNYATMAFKKALELDPDNETAKKYLNI